MCDRKKQLQYNTVPTSDNTLQTISIEKERLIVPIIFIPGVMGSNLKVKPNDTDKDTEKVWCLDGPLSVLGWALPHYGNARARKLELDPNKTMIDDRGKITEAITNNPENQLFGSRQARGWGTVGYRSYGKFLDKLQTSLFDQTGHTPAEISELLNKRPLFTLDEGAKTDLMVEDVAIAHCNRFYFPVHAMGYNWLESNEDSAMALQELVDVTLPKYYKKRGQTCDKVILITHSMGGLVARYYTQALRGEAKVLGVIHGVQPATGAVAAYTRMKRGTEVNTGFFGKPVAAITENVLGKDAAEMTAVCAQAPGPLQLLPTPEYGMGWLKMTDAHGNQKTYPSLDNPDLYNDIYLAKDKWWCACEPHLINPLNTDHNQKQMENDWKQYENIIIKKVKKFNSAIANQYHPNTYAFFGIENEGEQINMSSLTYQSAHWQAKKIDSHQVPPSDHIGDRRRLNLKELTGTRTIKNNDASEKYTLLPADGNGDGTVPQRSGEIPIKYLTARMHFSVEHEPAYQKDPSQDFTLRAIVDMMKTVTLS